jgi:type II secretory pathway pseudopilin PulG
MSSSGFVPVAFKPARWGHRAPPFSTSQRGADGRARRSLGEGGFTLAEVLAALLFMAILIPVTMHGVSVASRTGILGQRRAAAMRIAERVLDEQILSGQMATATPYGSITEGDLIYSWTMRSDPWPEDLLITMNVVTIRVEFNVQGHTYDVAVSTLHDPSVTSTTTTPETSTSSTAEP